MVYLIIPAMDCLYMLVGSVGGLIGTEHPTKEWGTTKGTLQTGDRIRIMALDP